ncbi:hypothetical protein [Apilactobacillus xinyiensis]|uniref:hypothetical protein n=1 Tax=Apilactobacillus xinyiensis TaxID=2841032 RepID=UPI00200DA13F|nr:hypothetical protein [Apilactobacillus xinyiensis]MCL0319481.1 hypothetical protein [Apilactobacillus xinyiensis]
MKVTATSNVQTKKSGYAGVQPHVERKLPDDRNENIYFNKSYLNIYGKSADYTKAIYKDINPWVKEHDSKPSNKYYKYGSVEGYLKKQNRVRQDRNMVSTFGDTETKRKIMDLVRSEYGLGHEEKVLKAFSTGLKRYADGFNKRNKHITLCDWGTNCDELGAPHIHMSILARTKTKRGKPSFNLNSALKKQFGNSKNQDNLRAFRQQEDSKLVELVGKSLHQSFPKVEAFKSMSLTRTGKQQSISMDEYKRAKKDNERLLTSNFRLSSENRFLRDEQKDLSKDLDSLRDDYSKQLDKNIKLESKNKRLESSNDTLTNRIADGYKVFVPSGYHNRAGKDVTTDVASHDSTPEHKSAGGYTVGGYSGLPLLLYMIKRTAKKDYKKLKELYSTMTDKKRDKKTSNTTKNKTKNTEDDLEL